MKRQKLMTQPLFGGSTSSKVKSAGSLNPSAARGVVSKAAQRNAEKAKRMEELLSKKKMLDLNKSIFSKR